MARLLDGLCVFLVYSSRLKNTQNSSLENDGMHSVKYRQLANISKIRCDPQAPELLTSYIDHCG